jgi:hypothetical protein
MDASRESHVAWQELTDGLRVLTALTIRVVAMAYYTAQRPTNQSFLFSSPWVPEISPTKNNLPMRC